MFFNGLPEMNVERVTVANTHIYAQTGAQINESTDVVLRNVEIVPEEGPALQLNNVRNLTAESFTCPAGLPTALTVTGSRNRAVKLHAEGITAANSRLSDGSEPEVTIE